MSKLRVTRDELGGGTCRGKDTLRIIELLAEYGPMCVADIGRKICRGTRYVCSLVDNYEGLHYTREEGLKRDYVVWKD